MAGPTKTSTSHRILPAAVAVAGICMALLSFSLLLKASHLNAFLHKLLGFIGVLFINSIILSYVAIRIALSQHRDATLGEKVFVLGLSLCTGVALAIAHVTEWS